MAVTDIRVPDIGGFENVAIVEVFVSAGDRIHAEDSLISLESDKAVMDIPSPVSGKITEMLVKADDTVSEGDLIARVEVEDADADAGADADADAGAGADAENADVAGDAAGTGGAQADKPPAKPKTPAKPEAPAKPETGPIPGDGGKYHASPSVRQYARELTVPLGRVIGTGPKGRITKEDVQAVVKKLLAAERQQAGSGAAAGSGAVAGSGIPAIPLEDFSRYGSITTEPLGRIQKISGPHLHAGWLNIPLVTHFDECNVTSLEDFRKQANAARSEDEVRLSILPFIVKAVVRVLKQFPHVNSSIDTENRTLILKHYYHIGIAVDTPDGLVVPTIKNADKKTVGVIAIELAEVSGRARAGKLKPDDFTGASFSISSLGGIGGTQFTPLVNAPQAAILGVSRAAVKPVWNGESFVPQTILPFSLSYDHRIIDGAEGARFSRALALELEQFHAALLE
jgi:pyruvate dehydrogenase E2 component (dihydrolipoamide acetyltransferase)